MVDVDLKETSLPSVELETYIGSQGPNREFIFADVDPLPTDASAYQITVDVSPTPLVLAQNREGSLKLADRCIWYDDGKKVHAQPGFLHSI